MVGSLWWLSSSSKKIRSGLTTLSLCSQAGKTSFLIKDSCVLLKDFERMVERSNESTRPTAAAAIKNFPFHGSLVWTNWFKTETLWSAYNLVNIYPICEDCSTVHGDTGPGLISLLQSGNFWVVLIGEVAFMGIGLDSISLFVCSFEFNHYWAINYFI